MVNRTFFAEPKTYVQIQETALRLPEVVGPKV